MSDDFIAPVKSIIKALDNGIKLAKRVVRSATEAPAAQALQISESAQKLQKSLETDAKAVSDAYRQGVAALGEPFSQALLDDSSIQKRLKDLRIDLIDKINDCPDFEDEPESFEPKPFKDIQEHSQICCTKCIAIFSAVQEELLQAGLQNFQINDSAPFHSMTEASPPAEPSPPPVPPKYLPVLEIQPVEPVKPKSPWSLSNPPIVDTGPSSPSRIARRPVSGEVSPLNAPIPRLIPKEIIDHRLSANDEFLERRRQSRMLWQDQLRQSSISSISEDQIIGLSPVASPILGSAITTASPIEASRLSGSPFSPPMARDRSEASHGTRSSRTSSLLHDIQERPRHDSTTSQESIFGLRSSVPLSPPTSEHRQSSGPEWGPIATTLHVPGFGNGVESGLEVVSSVDHDNGLILVNENQTVNQPTPTTSVNSIDYPMRHDASFYKFGGFCDGARAILRGDEGFKISTRPEGVYGTTISAKCIKCSYEVGYKDVEKDERLDRSGIYGNCGIRWRQRFITKCHVKITAVDKPLYACIFCIEEHKTVEEHDATIFFSVASLFRHLSTHPRPLPNVRGITVIYGLQPSEMVDFDIHYPSPTPSPSQYSMAHIAPKVVVRPAAYAISTHHPKTKHTTSVDPEGNPSLHFALGARIIGITFPDRFKGEWCIGYHDGQRGSFPASTIMLETPTREDVLMSSQSNLFATAKWDFKPKDAKDGGWLKFSKGDKISNIGYTFQDQWCWSGQTSKGKWGLFPASFVEGLREGGGTVQFSTSPSSIRSGMMSRMTSFGVPLRRPTSSRAERSASIRSNGSGRSMIGGKRPEPQSGLEVVSGGSSWRGH